RRGAPPAETPARRKAVWRRPDPTVAASVAGTAADATAGSGRLRSDVVTAATEAIACASSAPTGPASALKIVAPRAAPRFPERRRVTPDPGPLDPAEPRSEPPGNSDRCAQQHQRKPRSRHRSPPPVRLP